MREAFEKWATEQRCELTIWKRGIFKGEYKNPVVQKMYKAWQAANEEILKHLTDAAYDSNYENILVVDFTDVERICGHDNH